MKAKVIREMTTDEIVERLKEEAAQVAKLKMTHSISPIENPLQIRLKKRGIARLTTELRNRELTALKS